MWENSAARDTGGRVTPTASAHSYSLPVTSTLGTAELIFTMLTKSDAASEKCFMASANATTPTSCRPSVSRIAAVSPSCRVSRRSRHGACFRVSVNR